MRDLTALQEQSVSGIVTAPMFFVQIDLDERLHLSTRDSLAWQGQFFSGGKLRLGKVTHSTAELQIDNHDYRYTAGALAGNYMRGEVRVWWAYEGTIQDHYVKPGYWAAGYTKGPGDKVLNPIPIFSGLIYATPNIGEWLDITAHRLAPRLFPFRKLRPPLANHTPSAGYVINFDGAVLTVEGGR